MQGELTWGTPHAIERGFVKAPRFYHSGRFISQTGGHGDFRSIFEQSFAECPCCPAPQARFTTIADGVDSVRKAVREEFRRGARQVKLMSSAELHPLTISTRLRVSREILPGVEEADVAVTSLPLPPMPRPFDVPRQCGATARIVVSHPAVRTDRCQRRGAVTQSQRPIG